MACRVRYAEINVVWSARGVAWALYQLGLPGPGEPSPPAWDDHHRRMEAIVVLPGEGMLLSLHGSGSVSGSMGAPGCLLGARAAGRRRFLGAELPALSGHPARGPLRMVMQAANAEIAGAFGIPAGAPTTREASARSRQSEELAARLGQHLSLRPVTSEEMDSIRSPWCASGIGAGFSKNPRPGRPEESRRYGYLRLELEGGLAYRALLAVSRMPRGSPSGEWARVAEEAPFPVDWCLRTRPLPGSPVIPELATAILFSIWAQNLVELDERVAHLRRTCAEEALELDRPRDRQPALHTAMWPPAPFSPTLDPYIQLVAPQDLGPALPRKAIPDRVASERIASPSALAPYLLRIRRGPRQGVQVPLSGEIVVGRGGADLDLGDPSASTRHVAVAPVDGGVTLRNLGAPGRTHVQGRWVEGETGLKPGQSFLAGNSELILLQYGPAPIPAEAGPSGRRTSQELEIGIDGQADLCNVSIEAGGEATCGEVTRSVVEYLGLGQEVEYCAYRERGGLYLPAAQPWRQSGILRGDTLVIGVVAEGSPTLPEVGPAASPMTQIGPESIRTTISRPPRTILAPSPLRVRLPSVPQELALRGGGALWQVVAASGAAVTSIVVALALPGLRWIALAGGSTAILAVLAGFMAERSRRRFQRRQFLARSHELDRELEDAVIRQSAALEQAEPEVATLKAWAAQRDDRLWERRPSDVDFLVLRLGLGQRPSLIEIEGHRSDERGSLAHELAMVLARHDRIHRAPITLPGLVAPVVGVAGPHGSVEGLARSLIIQAAALHAPRELRIAFVAGSPEWSWARWLPHAASETGEALVSIDLEGADLIAADLGRQMGGPAGSALLILVDPEAGQRPSVAALSDAAGRSGQGHSQVILLAGSRHGLPSGCTTIIEVSDRDGTMIGAGTAGGPVHFSVETLSAEGALYAARSLAPLREAGAGTAGAARNAGLLELLGLEGPEVIPVEKLWYESC